VTRRVGNLGAGLAVIVFPVGLALVAVFVKHVIRDPDAGCGEECWGAVSYGIWWIAASVAQNSASSRPSRRRSEPGGDALEIRTRRHLEQPLVARDDGHTPAARLHQRAAIRRRGAVRTL
jgi:hypothetical protein